MRQGLRSWLKVVIGFVYSITILLTFLTFSLFGIKAEDTLEVIVTEATPPYTEVELFTITLQPMVIHNVFWLSLAGLGFLLIFLYFVAQRFKVLLGPGLLTLIMTLFVGIIMYFSIENIFADVEPYQELYLETAMTRFYQVVTGMTAFGVVLILLSYYGDQLFAKFKK